MNKKQDTAIKALNQLSRPELAEVLTGIGFLHPTETTATDQQQLEELRRASVSKDEWLSIVRCEFIPDEEAPEDMSTILKIDWNGILNVEVRYNQVKLENAFTAIHTIAYFLETTGSEGSYQDIKRIEEHTDYVKYLFKTFSEWKLDTGEEFKGDLESAFKEITAVGDPSPQLLHSMYLLRKMAQDKTKGLSWMIAAKLTGTIERFLQEFYRLNPEVSAEEWERLTHDPLVITTKARWGGLRDGVKQFNPTPDELKNFRAYYKILQPQLKKLGNKYRRYKKEGKTWQDIQDYLKLDFPLLKQYPKLLAFVPVLGYGKTGCEFEKKEQSAIGKAIDEAIERGFKEPADFAAEIAAQKEVSSYTEFAVRPSTLREDYLQGLAS